MCYTYTTLQTRWCRLQKPGGDREQVLQHRPRSAGYFPMGHKAQVISLRSRGLLPLSLTDQTEKHLSAPAQSPQHNPCMTSLRHVAVRLYSVSHGVLACRPINLCRSSLASLTQFLCMQATPFRRTVRGLWDPIKPRLPESDVSGVADCFMGACLARGLVCQVGSR